MILVQTRHPTPRIADNLLVAALYLYLSSNNVFTEGAQSSRKVIVEEVTFRALDSQRIIKVREA